MKIFLAEIDIGTLIGLVVAIQGVVCIIGIEWVKSKIEPLKERLDEIKMPDSTCDYSVDALADIAVEMQSILEVHTGLIHQLVSSSPIAKSTPNLSEENQKLRDRLERAMQELMLISDNQIRRRSALQQLSQIFGDQHSLDKMKRGAVCFPGDSDFNTSIEELQSRLM